MADFEDSCSPTWSNLLDGQQNLKDAIKQNHFNRTKWKKYQLNNQTATLLVRPRGLHLEENIQLEWGKIFSGALVDFGLFFFHNAETLINKN